ncbi:MAG TPA: serine/threonine-protein kinase [Nannocystaceae bacterium]|nr:serine/threonine-protein kinase [Nannocystaceae bacterium]
MPHSDPDATVPGEDSLATAPTAAPQPRQVGRYIVLDRIGAGAMGVVHAAYDPQLDRRIALKLVARGATATMEEIAAEARTLARVDHRGIVTVHDVGEIDGGLFIAMEFVEGTTLRERLRPHPSWRVLVPLFAAAADALAAAHRAGVVHGDFKPDNVMVGSGAHGRVTVLDFGLARLEGSKTDVTRLRGTPAYVSPEQIAGEAPSAKSDQFSFCVALYEAVCGVRPFSARTFGEAAAAFREGRATTFPPGTAAPRWLRALVVRGLAIDPAQRWPDLAAIAAALERGPLRWRRRAVVATAAGLAAIAVGLGIAEQRRCTDADADVRALWNPTVSAAIGEHVASELADLPPAAWALTSANMSTQTEQVAAWQQASCRARGGDVAPIEERRARCIDRAHAIVRGTVALLGDPDVARVRSGIAMGARLDFPECDDDEQVVQFPPVSADPEHRRRVVELEAMLASAGSTTMLGELETRERELDELIAAATELDESALLAEALIARGALSGVQRGPGAGYPFLRRGLAVAEADGIAILRARAWLAIANNRLGVDPDGDLVDIAFDEIEALLPSVPARAEIAVGFEHQQGYRATRSEDYADAIAHYDAAIAIAREQGLIARALPSMQGRIFAMLNASRLTELGEAAAELVAAREQVFGPAHPETASAHASAAIVHLQLGEIDRSIADFEGALRTFDGWGGRALVTGMATACNYCHAMRQVRRMDRIADVCSDCLARASEVNDLDLGRLWDARAQGLEALLCVAPERAAAVAADVVASWTSARDHQGDEAMGFAAMILAETGAVPRGLQAAHDLLAREPRPRDAILAALVIAAHDGSSAQRGRARDLVAQHIAAPESARLAHYAFVRAQLLLAAAGPGTLDREKVAKSVDASCSRRLQAEWAAFERAENSSTGSDAGRLP